MSYSSHRAGVWRRSRSLSPLPYRAPLTRRRGIAVDPCPLARHALSELFLERLTAGGGLATVYLEGCEGETFARLDPVEVAIGQQRVLPASS